MKNALRKSIKGILCVFVTGFFGASLLGVVTTEQFTILGAFACAVYVGVDLTLGTDL